MQLEGEIIHPNCLDLSKHIISKSAFFILHTQCPKDCSYSLLVPPWSHFICEAITLYLLCYKLSISLRGSLNP